MGICFRGLQRYYLCTEQTCFEYLDTDHTSQMAEFWDNNCSYRVAKSKAIYLNIFLLGGKIERISVYSCGIRVSLKLEMRQIEGETKVLS